MEGNLTYYGTDSSDGGLGFIQVVVVPERYGFYITVTDEALYRYGKQWREEVVYTFERRLLAYGKQLHGGVYIDPIADWKRDAPENRFTNGFFVHALVIDLTAHVGRRVIADASQAS